MHRAEHDLSAHKNPEIEALRAIAVMLVVALHVTSFSPWLTKLRIFLGAGWVGVDLFFAISGFVIASSFLSRLANPGIDMPTFRHAAAFWVRRIFRTLPAAWLWLGLPLIFSYALNSPNSFGDFSKNINDAVAAFLNVANFHWRNCHVLETHLCAAPGVFAPYWSLSLEEQFYLLFPLLVVMVRRWMLPLILVVIVLLQFPLMRPPWYGLWHVRTDAISLGVLLALTIDKAWFKRIEPQFLKNSLFGRSLALLWLVSLLAVIPTYFGNSVSCSTGMVAIVSISLVWLASYNRGYILKRGAVLEVFAYVGARSYSIYLCHVPAILLTKEMFVRRLEQSDIHSGITWTFVALAVLVALILVFGELTYRFVETPLRLLGRRKADTILANAHIKF